MVKSELASARAEALFASSLQSSDDPTPTQVRMAIWANLRDRGVRGCAEYVASEFGDHPLDAVSRMSWVLQALRALYPGTIPIPTDQ